MHCSISIQPFKPTPDSSFAQSDHLTPIKLLLAADPNITQPRLQPRPAPAH